MNRSQIVWRVVPLVAAALIVAPFIAPARADDDVSEPRTVSGFEKIQLNGAFKATIAAGGHGTHVTVSGSRDAVSRVTTEVRDGTLLVGMRDGSGLFSHSPTLDISLPVLRSFSNQGAGTITIAGLHGGDFAIHNSGTATIVASGRAAHESISLNGTGRIDTTAVDARDVTVDNNGVGSIHVRASGTLTMSVNGVGEIRYAGTPAHVQSQVNGVGRIGRL